MAQTTQPKTATFANGKIVVSAGYKTERVVGEDFIVDYVIPEDAPVVKNVVLGVYSGHFPSYSPPKKGVKTRPGSFGDRPLTWRIWKSTSEGKTLYHYEALVPYEDDQPRNRKKGLKNPQPPLGVGVWHIFVAAPDPQHIRELMEILKSFHDW